MSRSILPVEPHRGSGGMLALHCSSYRMGQVREQSIRHSNLCPHELRRNPEHLSKGGWPETSLDLSEQIILNVVFSSVAIARYRKKDKWLPLRREPELASPCILDGDYVTIVATTGVASFDLNLVFEEHLTEMRPSCIDGRQDDP